MIKEPPTIQESNMLEGALATKIAFEVQRINEVEKIDQRDLLMIPSKPTLISHIEFVTPDEFKDLGIKFFILTKVVKQIMVQVSMVKILIIHHFFYFLYLIKVLLIAKVQCVYDCKLTVKKRIQTNQMENQT